MKSFPSCPPIVGVSDCKRPGRGCWGMSGQVRLATKSELRAKGFPSPDKADALALAFMSAPSLEVWV